MSNIKTFASMALICTIITPLKQNLLHAPSHDLTFNHTMAAIGITAYTLIDGLSQIHSFITHYNNQCEGGKWYTNPDCVYHCIKAGSGIVLFYLLFGAGDCVVGGVVRRFEVRGYMEWLLLGV
jgi:hypothetical protein